MKEINKGKDTGSKEENTLLPKFGLKDFKDLK